MSNAMGATLSPRLSELVSYAHDTRAALETFIAAVPAQLHNTRAKAERWSVAEHVEHLGMIEDSIGRLISTMAKQLQAEGAVESEHTSMLNALDKFQLPSAATKLVAPKPYRPTGEVAVADAMEKLRSIRTRMLEGVQKANGFDLTKASFPHPFFGPLTGYEWLLLIAQHELRHLNQMKEDLQNLTATPSVASAAPQSSH